MHPVTGRLYKFKVAVSCESRAVAILSQILSRGALSLSVSHSLHGNVAGSWLQSTVYSSATRPGRQQHSQLDQGKKKTDTAASVLREEALEMASRKVWTKEETRHLISLYKSCPAVWDNQHVHYKDREKRSTCWNSMAEAMNTTSAEVQRKIHNLRNQVSVAVYCIEHRHNTNGF